MESFVIIISVIVGWVFSGQLNKPNELNIKLFDQFVSSDFISGAQWKPFLFISTLWSGLFIMVWIVIYLIFQNSLPLVFILNIFALAIMFNIHDVKRVISKAETLDKMQSAQLPIEVTELLTRTASRIFGLIFWYSLTPGLSGAILFFIVSLVFDAIVRSNSLSSIHSARLFIKSYVILLWLPHKFLSLGYAFVGDFETSLRCWREQGARSGAGPWSSLLASSGGALNILHGSEKNSDGAFRSEFGAPGYPMTRAIIPRVTGLLLRVFLLWTGIIFIVDALA